MLQRNRVFKKFLLSAAGLGVLVTIAACNQPQTTSEVAPAPDTTQAPTTEAPTTTQAPQTTTTDGTVAEVISDNESFSILEEAIGEAGLESTLAQAGPYTIFAPTDEAFRALPPETLEALRQPENRDKLQQILSYHVVPNSLTSADITPGEVETVAGAPVNIATDAGQVTVGGATVTEPDIQASNGVVHGIDQVLLPPDLQL
ncbi:MAG: fasciclin domain-containing protein [Elainella sp. C42_A2020_010]|nr:fasciclin domain-containing protein [Elainella sp. C42_A2020_010]